MEQEMKSAVSWLALVIACLALAVSLWPRSTSTPFVPFDPDSLLALDTRTGQSCLTIHDPNPGPYPFCKDLK
jgi:hypothetical protein